MFLGCQFSLYPMTDGFVGVILDAVKALDDYRTRLKVETDDISTTLIGPPEALFPALEASFLAAARSSGHVVMNVTFSRGCPGEPDDPICQSPALAQSPGNDDADRVAAALGHLERPPPTGVRTAAQIALYPLGRANYMNDIASCVAFAKEARIFDHSKHFCTRLEGDTADIFEAIKESFLGFAAPDSHVVLTAILSKGSPTQAA